MNIEIKKLELEQRKQELQWKLEDRQADREEELKEALTPTSEDGKDPIETALLMQLLNMQGVTPVTNSQVSPTRVIPPIINNPKIKLLIDALDKIPEEKLQELLTKLEKFTR